ncbi:MAG TPA: outer membrane protein assembly factor BamD [Candidatus Acidoferrales bacterium]|jgi:outer membrane protein assembly factor BamD|nr:outer membrane protein assembly factor BamD [Candidatus Acidoferrales bacterium]
MRGIKIAQVAALVLATALAGCFTVGKKSSAGNSVKKLPPIGDSAAPDKALYQRSMTDIDKHRYETARLELNALINTYPETEYLAKAKLAIADSFYKEGGTGNLAQAASQYKDFITFFPNLPEAPYAQMQVAMVHYRQLAKPDRDRSEAEFAEQEFQNFLKSYPDSELAPVAEQHLREVQEVEAEGDFRIASFYMMRQNYRAALGRLVDISNRYPLFSKSDEVLFMLATVSEKASSGNLQGKDKEAFQAAKAKLAVGYYSAIVTNYPLSHLVPSAKQHLTALGAPIPQPNAAALARMQQEQEISRRRTTPLTHVRGIINNGPDVSMAARVGTPNLNPPDDNGGGGETLNAALTNMNLSAGAANGTAGGRVEGGGGIQAGSGSNTGATEGSSTTGSSTNTSGEAKPPANAPPTSPANSTGAPPLPAGSQPPAPASGTTSTPGTSTSGTTNPANPSADSQPKPCADNKKDAKQQGSSSSSESSSNKNDKKNKKPDCSKTESSSQKKGGIHKIIPW